LEWFAVDLGNGVDPCPLPGLPKQDYVARLDFIPIAGDGPVLDVAGVMINDVLGEVPDVRSRLEQPIVGRPVIPR